MICRKLSVYPCNRPKIYSHQKDFLPLSTWKYRCELVLISQICLCCDWQRWVLLESSCNVLWITRTKKHNISENIELFSIPSLKFHKTVNNFDYQSFNKSVDFSYLTISVIIFIRGWWVSVAGTLKIYAAELCRQRLFQRFRERKPVLSTRIHRN